MGAVSAEAAYGRHCRCLQGPMREALKERLWLEKGKYFSSSLTSLSLFISPLLVDIGL